MAAPDTRSPRRWFQFRLGALFLLTTLVALWLAWELSYIRERKSLRAALEESGANVVSRNELQAEITAGRAHFAGDIINVPTWRRWLGDEAIVQVRIAERSLPEELDRVERVFPEAVVTIRTSTSSWVPSATPNPTGVNLQ